MDTTWLEVTVDTTEPQLDDLCAKLTMNGATGLAIEDENDFKTFLEQNRQYWDYVDDELLERMKGAARVKFYVTDDTDGMAQLQKWMAGIDLPWESASTWCLTGSGGNRCPTAGRRSTSIPDSPSAPATTPPPGCAWSGPRPR